MACCGSDAGGHNVEDGEDSRGHDTEGQDFIPRQAVTGHKDGGNGHEETFDEVLDSTVDDFRSGVHLLYIFSQDFSAARPVRFPPKKGMPPTHRAIMSKAAATAADREDFLEEDAAIPGQRFCLLSFLSPEKVLANKNVFMFEKFLDNYEFASRTKNLEAFLVKTVQDINSKLDKEADAFFAKDMSGCADICLASKLRVDTLMDDFHGFVKKNERELRESKLREAYDDFIFSKKAKLEDEFYAKNEFRTTVRGLKVRGVYGSQDEAVARSKRLQRLDPLHNIFVGEVGKWLPWDPEPNDVAEQEYAEDQLNTLMKKYKENEDMKDQFQREQRERIAKQGKKAAEPGVVITREEGAAPAPADGAAATAAAATAAAATPSQNFADMFGSAGPADLAIARKLERKAAEEAAGAGPATE